MSEALAPPLPANDAFPLDCVPAGLAHPTTVPQDEPALDGDHDAWSGPEDAVFEAAAPLEIQDLVDAPCRALEIEYKSWRNLDNAEDRAELARDIAALANHGGGFIVFGFSEHTLEPDETDPFRTNCTVERVRSIVQTYLDPPIRCEVVTALSSAGAVHSIIRVGGHGATPVCVRQDGPAVAGERLIERGAYYVRKHGSFGSGPCLGVPCPQSARIELAQDWAPLIRRCVRRDRETLLAMLDASIDGRAQAPETAQRLHTWHHAARAAFQALVPRSPVAERLGRCHYVLSYGFELIRPEMLEHAQLPERLRRTVFDVQTQFRSGWNMFDPPYRRGVQARFVTDAASGDDEVDFLEAAWLRARNPGEIADFWRVSPRGFATVIRPYPEDKGSIGGSSPTLPGTYLSPFAVAQEVAELVCHARAFARLFAGAQRVAFRCEWLGLKGRALFDPDGHWPHRGPALSDRSVATAQVSLARLAHAWPEVVAQLIASVVRAVEPDVALDGDWVRRQTPRWATPP